jgi:hypothetical protein
LFTKSIGSKYQYAACHGWQKARHEVSAFDHPQQYAREEDVQRLGIQQWIGALGNVQGLQRKGRFRVA